MVRLDTERKVQMSQIGYSGRCKISERRRRNGARDTCLDEYKRHPGVSQRRNRPGDSEPYELSKFNDHLFHTRHDFSCKRDFSRRRSLIDELGEKDELPFVLFNAITLLTAIFARLNQYTNLD